jgi:diguanylate cyclase (GGDEF)-like protein/PAS domain S-box-containing protein
LIQSITSAAALSQTVQARDVIGLVFGLFGLTYWWVWRRDRDPGMGWLAAGWILLGTWIVSVSYQDMSGPNMVWSNWSFVVLGAVVCISLGLIDYLEVPARQRTTALAATLIPAGMLLAIKLYVAITGGLIPRWVDNPPIALWYTSMGVLIWQAGRRESGADHRMVAAAFFLLLPLFLARAIAGRGVVGNNFIAAIPIIMLGLSLLTSTLLRRRRALEAEVARRCAAEERYRTLAEWTPEAIFVHRDGLIEYANPAFAIMYGARSAGDLIGQPVPPLVPGIGRDEFRGQIARLDGVAIQVETKSIDIMFDGNPALYVVARDITARMKAEANIQRLAYFDDLTGLPNRRLFMDRIADSLRGAVKSGQRGAVLFIDLDNFKHLNDARGHSLGDRLLVEVSKRVAEVLQPQDTFARLGGDEFVVIVNDLGTDVEMAQVAAMGVAETIRLQLESPFDIEGNRYSGTGSIGLTLFPKPKDGADNLLREADTAMYRAKTAGRNRIAYFEPAMQSEAEERFALEEDLKVAIDTGQIDVHVQPQFETGMVETGGELLLRWTHPTRGPVSPVHFIPIAEESGLILRLGDLVLRRACEALARMEQDGCLIPLSVNISPLQFHQDDFVARMRTILATTGARASHLVFEVTEGLFIDQWQRVAARMTELAEMGIRFSIDDFGTGYSSLAYLKKLPLQEIKIDRQFVQGTTVNANDRAIVVSIIAVARTFNLRIVAEGVETQAQADILAEEGCDCYQGFFFARPMPLDFWLEQRRMTLGTKWPTDAIPAYHKRGRG